VMHATRARATPCVARSRTCVSDGVNDVSHARGACAVECDRCAVHQQVDRHAVHARHLRAAAAGSGKGVNRSGRQPLLWDAQCVSAACCARAGRRACHNTPPPTHTHTHTHTLDTTRSTADTQLAQLMPCTLNRTVLLSATCTPPPPVPAAAAAAADAEPPAACTLSSSAGYPMSVTAAATAGASVKLESNVTVRLPKTSAAAVSTPRSCLRPFWMAATQLPQLMPLTR
jgi:hypothetical protein